MSGRMITTVCLVTDDELSLLGTNFSRAWPIDDTPCFQGLLQAIDNAEREIWRARDSEAAEKITVTIPGELDDELPH